MVNENELQCGIELQPLRVNLQYGFSGRPDLAIPVHVVDLGRPMPDGLVVHLEARKEK